MRSENRRTFFKKCVSLTGMSLASTAARLGQLNAATVNSDYKALVCIFLFGGSDSNHVLVPASGPAYTQYATGRAQLAIPASSLLNIGTTAGQDYGLHPALVNVKSLYSQGRAAIVANVGSLVRPITRAQLASGAVRPPNLYSHSHQTGQWQAGVPEDSYVTGWSGRAADKLAYLNTPAQATGKLFPATLSVSGLASQLSGDVVKQTVIGSTSTRFGTTEDLNNPPARLTALQELLTFDEGLALVQAANGLTRNGLDDARALNDLFLQSTMLGSWNPTTGLARQLKQIARIIEYSARLGLHRQVFFAGMGGFDTHDNQTVQQNALFAQIDGALGEFQSALQTIGAADKVMTFTESEFNRTFNPNGNNGTDHAWGGNHIVVGPVAGGVYGRYPSLAINTGEDGSSRGAWIPSTSFDQYGATLARWFGVPSAQMGQVFPNLVNFPSWDLGF